MTMLDAILLVAAAAIGMGVFQLSRRGWFKGHVWIVNHGIPDVHSWSTTQALVTCAYLTVHLTPLVAPWTILLLVLRMRPPRPRCRQIWRQPGMAACLAVLVGWFWTVFPLLLALNVAYVARSRRSITPDDWAQKYLADELFIYVGLAVGATWLVQYASGRWRKPADWIDRMGVVVGALWIVIGLVWTLREYIDFV
jgi:hypothetical protein